MRVTSDIYMVSGHNRRAAKEPLWIESGSSLGDFEKFGIRYGDALMLAKIVARIYSLVCPKGRSPNNVIFSANEEEFSVFVRTRMNKSEEGIHFTKEDVSYLIGDYGASTSI